MTKMTTEEAFIKVLQMHGIEHSFGIIGSAFGTGVTSSALGAVLLPELFSS